MNVIEFVLGIFVLMFSLAMIWLAFAIREGLDGYDKAFKERMDAHREYMEVTQRLLKQMRARRKPYSKVKR